MTTLLIHSANILTLAPNNPTADAVLIGAEQILAVGQAEAIQQQYAGQIDQFLDAHGATILPGFIDAHIHLGITALGLLAVDLDGCDSIPALLGKIHAASLDLPEQALMVAINFQPELNSQNRWPSLEELDQAGRGHPIYLMERTGHISLVNSAAGNLTNPPLPAGILRGHENSTAFTQLWDLFSRQANLPHALTQATQVAARNGVTTLHALDDLDVVKVILAEADHLPVHIVAYTQSKDISAVQALGLRQIGGCGSVMVDGDFSPHTAALLDPYLDDPTTAGILYYSDQELDDYVLAAHRAGLQVALHCVGSAAIEQLLNAYERALIAFPRSDHRHRIEHFELPAPGQKERALNLGICLSMQPAFNHYWPHTEEYPQIVGEARAALVDPLASLHAAGLPIALGSDSPVTPVAPLLWLQSAVTHSNPSERVTVLDALRMATTGGSYAAFEEGQKGTLEPGKLADLVFLSANPADVASDQISTIQVLKTMVAGRFVYEHQPEGEPCDR